jgi:hypothetical protein
MTIVKSLAIVALLVGGTSLAMAQNGPPTPPATSGPPGPGMNPAPNYRQSAAPGARTTHRTTHHMYMSTRHHKPLKTGQPMPKQPQ